ncbi:MAG: transcriptional regulator NrdR [Patescibacteria group bacterium]
MKCPACHKLDTRVMDSRLIEDGMAIRRRRECARCDFRFSTIEETEILNLTVIKRDGRHEPYSREKMETGLRRSFQKLPITQDELKRLVNHIERDIQITGRQEIKSADIGDILMKHLKRANHVAYIRFASVYRSFKDVETFQRELHSLLKPARHRPDTLRESKRAGRRLADEPARRAKR